MVCPLCRRPTTWKANPWRPFCSERCQLTDLGTWASEGYRLPAQNLNLPAPSEQSDEIADEVAGESMDKTPDRETARSDDAS
jgi:endogenous inhibitor of DNA gyrase (YacG/DUF329 family)